jgi:hypothetical protein
MRRARRGPLQGSGPCHESGHSVDVWRFVGRNRRCKTTPCYNNMCQCVHTGLSAGSRGRYGVFTVTGVTPPTAPKARRVSYPAVLQRTPGAAPDAAWRPPGLAVPRSSPRARPAAARPAAQPFAPRSRPSVRGALHHMRPVWRCPAAVTRRFLGRLWCVTCCCVSTGQKSRSKRGMWFGEAIRVLHTAVPCFEFLRQQADRSVPTNGLLQHGQRKRQAPLPPPSPPLLPPALPFPPPSGASAGSSWNSEGRYSGGPSPRSNPFEPAVPAAPPPRRCANARRPPARAAAACSSLAAAAAGPARASIAPGGAAAGVA